MMTENTRRQIARCCAGEAIEALYSTYWADSFDAALLESTLAETIYAFTQNARHLTEARADALKQRQEEASHRLMSSLSSRQASNEGVA